MLFELRRVQRDPDVTIGDLSILDRHICWVCEDPVRDHKIPKVTAIPVGRYQIVMTWSPRFHMMTPQLLNVPNYDYIRFHPGNDPDDTEGCLLPGRVRRNKSVEQSKLAYHDVLDWIEAALGKGEEVWINITEPALDPNKEPDRCVDA